MAHNAWQRHALRGWSLTLHQNIRVYTALVYAVGKQRNIRKQIVIVTFRCHSLIEI